MTTIQRIMLAGAVALAVAIPSTGCRTGIRRVANAIEGQGASSVGYSQTADGTTLDYLTSENSSLDAEGVDIEVDPASGVYKIKVKRAQLQRAPSENQEYFAAQLAQGRTADTEALAAYGAMAGAIVEGAVNAAIQAALPAYTTRQEQKTARREIGADRDVELARIGAEHSGGEEAAVP